MTEQSSQTCLLELPVRLGPLVSATALGLGLVLAPAAAAGAAPPDRDGLNRSAVNGGDKGWGNCGYNSSGGRPHTALDDGGKNKGNGGFKKGDTCPSAVSAPGGPTSPTDPAQPADPTEPGEPASPTEPTDPTDPTDPSDPGADLPDGFPGGGSGPVVR